MLIQGKYIEIVYELTENLSIVELSLDFIVCVGLFDPNFIRSDPDDQTPFLSLVR